MAAYEPPEGRQFSRTFKALALIVALFFVGIGVLSAGYSLLRAPPEPQRTRPLPPAIPHQGALR